MIEFVCGRSGSGKSEYVAEKIREALASIGNPLQGGSPKKLYLIIPEQQAVVWESRVARCLPPSAALSLEIVNFTRLSDLVNRAYGGFSDSYITKGGKAALMWSTLCSLAPSLSIYGDTTRPERAAPTLLSAISEMKRSAVSPARLEEAADVLEQEEVSLPLARRLRELSLIAATYQYTLEQRYTDDEDTLAHLEMRLKDQPFFAGADVFVDSFFSLTAVEMGILTHIFRQAENVTVTFSCSPREDHQPQFASPRAYLDGMRAAADRLHREYKIVSLEENRRPEKEALRYLEANLWKFDAPPFEGDTEDAIRLLSARDRYAEAEAVAACIQQKIRAGARYSEIAVIARHADALRGILDTTLQQHDIPCFFSEPADISARPAARLILAALHTVGGGWRREDVILCAKTGLCALTDDETDALELYTATWHIRGIRAFSQAWNMNPDGYTAAISERGQAILLRANEARDKLIPPLERFASVFTGGSAPIAEICRAVYELLCDFGVWDSLTESAASLEKAGRHREASEQSQLWDILMDALDTLAEVLPEERADPSAFSALLRQVLHTVRVGSIPGGMDEVVIGSADQVRLGEIRHVILLGAVDGEFPGTPSDDGFFSDTDKIFLEGVEVNLSPTTDIRMKEELFWFYRAASLPHQSLTVLIPQTDGATPLSPSLAAERIRTLFPTVSVENTDAWGATETVFTPADAQSSSRIPRQSPERIALQQLGALSPRIASPIPLSGQNETVDEETAALLFQKNISLTQSRLDSFVLCRFGYYCKYVLKLEEEKEASLTAVNVGTFLHRVLELFFARLSANAFPLPGETLLSLTDDVVRDVVEEICPGDARNGRAQYLFTRLKRCVLPILRALDEEFSQSEFRPVHFELPIGVGENAPVQPLPVNTGDGHTVLLRGTVDRVDAWRDGDDTYIRVVDYKTGAKKFVSSDISIGVNVQLLLYLFSLLRCPPGEFRTSLTGKADGALKPAGALYFSAQPGASRSEKILSSDEAREQVQNDILRSGILVEDEHVLRAMEPDLAGKFLPVKYVKKDDRYSGTVSDEELSQLEETMRQSIARIGRELCSGGAQAQPQRIHTNDPCAFCQMKPICRVCPSSPEGDTDHSDAKEDS